MTQEQIRLLDGVEESFLPKVKTCFGDNLVSVTVYGSAITERFTDGVSDVNLLILLDVADPAAVASLGSTAARTIRKLRITPLLLTDEEFIGSADVFPMEYLDIVDQRRVLIGADVAGKLTITRDHLRHQVEFELRASIAALRRALLATRGKKRPMMRILKGWSGSQNALFRGLLRLRNIEEVPIDTMETISKLGSEYGIDTSGLAQAADLRLNGTGDTFEAAEAALLSLTALAAKIDSMEA